MRKKPIHIFFFFSKPEIRGITFLIACIGFLYGLRLYLNHVAEIQFFTTEVIESKQEEFFREYKNRDRRGENYSIKKDKTWKKEKRTYNSYRRNKKQNEPIIRPSGKKKIRFTIDIVDLNLADTTALECIPGIGTVLARRILKYRDLLGGYYSTYQIKDVYGFDDTLYCRIQRYIAVDTLMVRKIDLNTADFQILSRHPYISSFEARSILDFRRLVGPFKQKKQLLEYRLLSEETYNKTEIYFTIE